MAADRRLATHRPLALPDVDASYRRPHARSTGIRVYERWRPLLFSAPALGLLLIFLIWPLIWSLGMSFTSWDGLGPIHWAGLNTWNALFEDTTFQAALRNTLIWVLLSA